MSKTVIELAKQAGWEYADGDGGFEPLWRFAEIVRADERAKLNKTLAEQVVAYGMWDTMLGKDNRMMMVRLDKGQDGCTVPLTATPQAQREPVAWPIETNNQVEALAKQCGWDNRRYMAPADYQIWCDRMRQFVQLASPQAQPAQQEPTAKRLDPDDAWNFAKNVWNEMDRKAMPGIYMQLVTEAIVKHYTTPQTLKEENT